MERNRPPASTSPWKVGFLVSLLLVAMSIGVGYAITRTYGIEWTWIAFTGPSWFSFTFDLDAFKREMILLVMIVPAGALLSSLVISSAVRQHRAANDPAAEYKKLIRSLSNIKDLNDERKIRKIAGHRELRDFLVKIRNEVNEREKAIADREAALEARETNDMHEPEGPSGEALSAEAAILSTAVMNAGEGGFKEALALNIPELKQVEAAIRVHLEAASVAEAPVVDTAALEAAQRENETLRADLQAARASVADVSEELGACARSAQEIESIVGQARAAVDEPESGGADTIGSVRILDALDAASETLLALGDETKAIAIEAATQASSAEDAQNGIVQVADSMREIAGRFAQIAASWNQTTSAARAALKKNSNDDGTPGRVAQIVQEASKRVSLWVERSTLLADRIANQAGDEVKEPAQVPEPAEIDGVNEYAASTNPEQGERFDLGEDQDEMAGATREFDITIEKPAPQPTLEEAAPQVADIPGIVKEKKLFKGEAAADSEFFVDIPGQENAGVAPKQEVIEEVVEATLEEVAAEAIEQEPQPASISEDDNTNTEAEEKELAEEGFLTGPRGGKKTKASNGGGMPDADADAVDLYTLGAIDYQPQGAAPQN